MSNFFVAHSSRALAKIDIIVKLFCPASAVLGPTTTPQQLVAAETYLSALADTVTAHEQRSTVGATASNKFREAARTTDNCTTKLLAEGLTALTEALRELDAKLETTARHATQAE